MQRIIDAHNDLLSYLYLRRRNGARNILRDEFLPDFQAAGVKVIVCSIYIENEYIPEMALRQALDQISTLHAELDGLSGEIRLCANRAQLEQTLEAGAIAFLLSLEGVEPLYNDPLLLRVFYELGVRLVGLTWSRRNYAADGALFTNTRNVVESGLTDFGHELLCQMQQLGMLLDVSHLSPNAFWEIARDYDIPMFASHSNTQRHCPMKRNLDDDQIRLLAERGGVIGMNGANVLVTPDSSKASPADMVSHMVHVRDLIDIQHIGIGLDMCTKMLEAQGSSTFTVGDQKLPFFDVIPEYRSIPELTKEMEIAGFTEADIDAVLFGNFLDFLKRNL